MNQRSGRIPRIWDRAMPTAAIGVPIGAGRLTRIHSRLHQFPDACLIRHDKGILLTGPAVMVRGQEFTGLITAEAEDHPDQVAGYDRMWILPPGAIAAPPSVQPVSETAETAGELLLSGVSALFPASILLPGAKHQAEPENPPHGADCTDMQTETAPCSFDYPIR